ncbi:hypothetical protein FSP39_013944 [Pinctada imbricata]|uniref:Uncharacterized protein n=1 Tax=Pinctada imbricata TaxID=66713 RepID=A0AA88YTI7_PINIB|nr:hypothetical protein FSP39_013944 [Pinctada imbricata]
MVTGDPNKADLLVGNTSVHYAAKEDHVECLQCLLQAGGLYSVRNSEGKTCLDVATGECFKILESLKVKDLMTMSPEEARKDIQGEDSGVESPDMDCSISTDNEGSVAEDVMPPALGYIHLTFEYHSHKETLKIRVWQISDLLLPPPSTSMISTIYAKSYLMPDKKKESKRKTEEVKVEKVAAHVQFTKSELSQGVQHVFSPSTFQFSKKLEYSAINKDVIKDKSVQIEICITQKYTKRTYMIGMFHMSLGKAVKKIVREKYPLIPCMNHTIPSNMKVYCASELQITNSKKIFYSNPDVRCLSVTDISNTSDRAASDPDLQGVTISDVVTPRSVSLDVDDEVINPPSPRDHKLDEVIVKAVSKNTAVLNIPGEFVEGEISSDEETSKISSRVIEMSETLDDESKTEKNKSAFSSVKNVLKSSTKVESIPKKKQSKHSGDADQEDNISPRGVQDWKYKDVKRSSGANSKKSEVISDTGSRPETPTWDYYDFDDLKVVVSDIPIDESPIKPDGATPVCLPMETTLGLRSDRTSLKKKKDKGKKEKKRGSTEEIHWPGRAVPTIVVTDMDKEKIPSRSQSTPKKHTKIKKKSPAKEEEIVLYTPEKKQKDKSKNVAINLQGQELSRSSDGKFKVTADIHSPPSPDTSVSIDVTDSDSFIIDLENLESDLASKETDVSDSEMSLTFNTPNLTHSDSSVSSRLRSNLALTRPIPMQVFIDDSIYDSDLDISEKNMFVPIGQGQNDDMITEV